VLVVQELKTMVADDAVFKADGVVYTSDTKGERCATVMHIMQMHAPSASASCMAWQLFDHPQGRITCQCRKIQPGTVPSDK
jgi:hypothetical protein